VLLLSEECLETLLLWFDPWRIDAMVRSLGIEINARMLAGEIA
jgi:hypothetical protein